MRGHSEVVYDPVRPRGRILPMERACEGRDPTGAGRPRTTHSPTYHDACPPINHQDGKSSYIQYDTGPVGDWPVGLALALVKINTHRLIHTPVDGVLVQNRLR